MKTNSVVFLLVLTIGIAGSPTSGADLPKKQHMVDSNKIDTSKPRKAELNSSFEEGEIRKILMELEGTLSSKAADKAAALFADDVNFIDQTGNKLHGRQTLQDRFDALFKQETVPAITVHPEEIKLPANNVAVVIGVVGRRQSGTDLPSTRFSMVLLKSDAGWKISEFTETLLQDAQGGAHLQQLSWLIGNWHVNNAAVNTNLNVEWAPGKKFIFSKCVVNRTTKTSDVDTQIIGWDPRSKSIVSWHFDTNGGFGTGVWTNDSQRNEWNVAVQATGADGSTTRATNVFSLKKADQFEWKSIGRSLDDVAVGDTEPLTLQRVVH